MPKILSHKEKVQRAVGKRPQSATQIAAKLGHNTHHGVAKDLGTLVKEGKVEKVKGKYAAR